MAVSNVTGRICSPPCTQNVRGDWSCPYPVEAMPMCMLVGVKTTQLGRRLWNFTCGHYGVDKDSTYGFPADASPLLRHKASRTCVTAKAY